MHYDMFYHFTRLEYLLFHMDFEECIPKMDDHNDAEIPTLNQVINSESEPELRYPNSSHDISLMLECYSDQ